MTTTRRQVLAGGAALGAAAAAGGAGPAAAQSSAPISIALAARAPSGLSPHQTALTGGDSWAIRQCFDWLVKPEDGTFAIRPEDFRPSLAESWESTPDAKTWTYRLRRGVPFHKNHGEMTSEDVVFSFARHLDPALVTNQKALYANLARVEAVDRYTVRFHLRRPDPLFNGSTITNISSGIMSKRAFEERGAQAFNLDPIGTGPFQVESVSQTQGVMFSAFQQHFDGVAAWPALRVGFIADTTARTLAFASGQVDMIEGVRQPGWIPTMRQRMPQAQFDATAPGSFNTLHLNLNRPPLNDLRVRQAIRLAINNEAIAAAYPGLSVPMVGIIAPQFAGSVRKQDLPPELRWDHDPRRARALLAEAGHPNGVTIQCFTSQREDFSSIMLMLQEQLRAVGIRLDMRIIDHATMHAENRRDRNNVALYSLSYPPVPTTPFLHQLHTSAEVKPDMTGGENYSHYGVAMPGLDALIERAEDEPDFERRTALIQDMERQVLRDLPLLGLVTLSYVIARNPRIDVGYPVRSGPAYWPLNKARRV
jgi:peptide/nickel transport system substrate-binding protein